MRFALIITTEQRSHLFHARMSCAEGRCITTSRATGYTSFQSSSYHPSSSPSYRSPFVKSTRHPPRCIDAALLTTVLLSSLSGEPLRSLRTCSVSLTQRLSFIPPRAIAVSLVPNRSRVSSLPPPARADHVLFSRSPPSGMRPCAATVRNSCCACVKS